MRLGRVRDRDIWKGRRTRRRRMERWIKEEKNI